MLSVIAKLILSFDISVAPIHGNWGTFGVWSACSVTCGIGGQASVRVCNNPSPTNGGRKCSGRSVQTRVCIKICRGKEGKRRPGVDRCTYNYKQTMTFKQDVYTADIISSIL